MLIPQNIEIHNILKQKIQNIKIIHPVRDGICVKIFSGGFEYVFSSILANQSNNRDCIHESDWNSMIVILNIKNYRENRLP
mgnify:FL=1